MKTLNSKTVITESLAKNFKKTYNAKMGGTQTLVFPNGETFLFNDKEYYSGRGAKYNSSINHSNLGTIEISKKEVIAKFKAITLRNKEIFASQKAKKIAQKNFEIAYKKGIYNINTAGLVDLGDKEFSPVHLANTLSITISDAFLLLATGKTYVFAKSDDGRIYQLYHPSLSCNEFTVFVSEVSETKYVEFATQWGDHQLYSGLLGQTNKNNHFVC